MPALNERPADHGGPPPIVTLFESYGAGADRIGPRVAEALGLPFHAQAFSSEQLEGADTGEETEGPIGRVLSAMGRPTAVALGATGLDTRRASGTPTSSRRTTRASSRISHVRAG